MSDFKAHAYALNRVYAAIEGGRIVKFCGVGVLNTTGGVCSYLFFSEFMNMYLANALAWFLGCLCGYLMHKYWTFHAADTGASPFVKFALVNLGNIVVSLIAMRILASLGGGRIWSYIFSLPVTMTVSYLGYRFWSFKKVDGRV